MSQTYTAQIQHRGEWWIRWIREVSGVTCQERTREALLETLQITLREALEFEAHDARERAAYAYEEVKISV